MRIGIFCIALLFGCGCLRAQTKSTCPLAKYSKEWAQPKYLACNTAAKTKYLNDTEKLTIYVLNLARMNPKLFSKTVLPHAGEISYHNDTTDEEYYGSLVHTMDTMKPLPLLYPDSLCYVSAKCHVLTSGPLGLVTHERQTPECFEQRHKNGECCAYGHFDALGMIVELLIDRYTTYLGHRVTCLGDYTKIGVATGPHSTYKIMATLDFWH